jgi:hypothetical protein
MIDWVYTHIGIRKSAGAFYRTAGRQLGSLKHIDRYRISAGGRQRQGMVSRVESELVNSLRQNPV